MSTPGIYSFLCKNTENKHCIRVPKIFFIMWGLWVSKDAEFNVGFTNINLP
jgi:hypothetical protein